jgi:hypothetical protein
LTEAAQTVGSPGPCLRHRLIYRYETVIYRVKKDVALECAGRSWNVTSGGTTR